MSTSISIKKLQEMFCVGAKYICNNYEYINQLNIFPIPDGDTGSNMKITTENAANIIIDKSFTTIDELAKTYGRALLMNARGNSGVIFTQIIKGFLKNFDQSENYVLSKLGESLQNATDFAYQSLQNPIEGTILTIIRLVNENYKAKKNSFKSFEDAFNFIVNEANKALERTPEFLEDLKNAKVVDSGAYGLCKFFEGMRDCLFGEIDVKHVNTAKVAKPNLVNTFEDNNEGFGYCCEFIMSLGSKVVLSQKNKQEFDKNKFEEELSKLGDCLVIVVDDNIVKVHIHSSSPYKVLQIGQKYGEFNNVKIENMTLQFIEKNPNISLAEGYKSFAERKQVQQDSITRHFSPKKLIVTAPTKAIKDLFINQLNVDYVISYENSGNPSIQDFLTAFTTVQAQKIILIIDDTNILLAATEAVKLFGDSSSIEIVVAKNIIITYLCALSYIDVNNFSSNLKVIKSIVEKTHFASITKSTKHAVFNNITIKPNQFFGMIDKKIKLSNNDLYFVVKEIISEYVNEYFSRSLHKKKIIFNIFVGQNAPINITRKIDKYINETYGCKTKIINTNETIYFYHFACSIQ